MSSKSVEWVGTSLDDLRAFPQGARRRAGYQLRRLQMGLDPEDWRPMSLVGPGVRELRIRVEGEWRVVYLARLAEAVYVLHCFRKKSTKTPIRDIEIARERFRIAQGIHAARKVQA